MNKIYFILFSLILSFSTKGQIPNAGFENMNSDSTLEYWSTATFVSLGSNDTILYDIGKGLMGYSTKSRSGKYALAIGNGQNFSQKQLYSGSISTTPFINGDPAYDRRVNIPLSRPAYLYFYYRFEKKNVTDTAECIISLGNQQGIEIGAGRVSFWDFNSEYQLISIPISYNSNDLASTIVVEIKNNTTNSPIKTGTILLIDDMSFTTKSTSDLSNGSELNFDIYPNPTSDILEINTNLQFDKYEIFDVLGCKTLSNLYNSKIDVSTIPKGVYTIRLTKSVGDISLYRKFIKQEE